MVNGSAIGTLVVFVWSIILVIYPVSIPVFIPKLGRKKFPLNLTTAPIIAIAILWAAQCLGPTEIRTGIVGSNGVKPYNILILFFSLAYMAITLDITGVLQSAAYWVSNRGGSNGWKLFIYFYIMVTVLSVFIGNDPVILSGTAFLVYYTNATNLKNKSWLISEFAAANTASMVLFVGNPTNVVICEGFRINNAAFTAYTILPFLACSITCLGALALQFRSPAYIKPRLDQKKDLDVRSVLLDPLGAWVGSLLLGACLVVIIVVSFFHVDVWMISLPFAAAKFMYDVGIDHWRYTRKYRLHPTTRKQHDNVDLPPGELIARRLKKNPPEEKTSIERQSPSVLSHKESIAIPPTPTLDPDEGTHVNTRTNTDTTMLNDPLATLPETLPATLPSTLSTQEKSKPFKTIIPTNLYTLYERFLDHMDKRFPTLYIATPRLPFALVPFAFSQFILIEALARQGWIRIFSSWLVIASRQGSMHPTIWLIGVLGVILCNIAGTNIGATILLTKVVQGAGFEELSALSAIDRGTFRAAAISLAVASNIGAVSFTFSASLAGLLWRDILIQKDVIVKQWVFAKWNFLPLLVMSVAGLGVVSAEMAILYR